MIRLKGNVYVNCVHKNIIKLFRRYKHIVFKLVVNKRDCEKNHSRIVGFY